jgi:hypothetical protein
MRAAWLQCDFWHSKPLLICLPLINGTLKIQLSNSKLAVCRNESTLQMWPSCIDVIIASSQGVNLSLCSPERQLVGAYYLFLALRHRRARITQHFFFQNAALLIKGCTAAPAIFLLR